MSSHETVSAQVPIPAPLYNADSGCAAIAQRAQTLGHSITHEILDLLTASLQMDELSHEIAAWEAASDEDWSNLETLLTHEVH